MLLGALGTNELIILFIIGGAVIVLPIYFIYKYGKQKGRIKEMERQMKEREKDAK
jgi:hypothetical protein